MLFGEIILSLNFSHINVQQIAKHVRHSSLSNKICKTKHFPRFQTNWNETKIFNMISHFFVDVRWRLSRCFELFRYRSIHLLNKVSKLEHRSIVQILCLVIKISIVKLNANARKYQIQPTMR